MSRKTRNVLTALIVVVLTAIYVVGLFLLWDVFDVQKTLDDLFEKDLYGGDKGPSSTTQVTVEFGGKSVTEAEELLLSEYFKYIYAGYGALAPENISLFYENQSSFELFDDLAYKYEISMLKKCPLDLSFGSCSIDLEIKRRHSVPKTSRVEIDLELSAAVEYNNTGVKSQTRSESHSFIIDESEKKPLIREHSTDRLCHAAAQKALDKVLLANGYYRSDLNYSFFPKYTDATLEMLKTTAQKFSYDAPENTSFEVPEYDYDRSKAVNTAINGFGENAAFKKYDENDANYVSRCIFEGGIPMDSQGERWDQWKWYDEEVNLERRKTGCSVTWYDREAFYKYTQVNKGFGMIAAETSSGGGDLGDVVQLLDDEGKAIAEFMITGVMAAQDGSVKDYLVSNDIYSSASLLSMGYTSLRVIHIIGYSTG